MWEWLEANYGCAICGLLGLVSAVCGLVRYLKLKVRNAIQLPDALCDVAAALSGSYEGPGLFGRRPTVRGSFAGLPVVVDFPDNWRETLLGDGLALAAPVWLRMRFTVPGGLRGRVRRRRPFQDLDRLGVPARITDGGTFEGQVCDVLPRDGGDLVVRRGVAVVKVPIEWDAAALPSGRVLGLLESAHAVVRVVCDALGQERPAGELSPS